MKLLLLIMLSIPPFGFAQDPTGLPPVYIGEIRGDWDPDRGDSLTYRIVAGNYGRFFFLDGKRIYVDRAAYKKFRNYRTWRIVLEVCDRKGACAIKTVTITLRKVDGVPVKPREIIT